MREYYFPKNRWTACNKSRYYSSDEGLDMLETMGDGRDEQPLLLYQGFLTSYGSADFQNDVNIYAEYLFVESKRLAAHSKKYMSVQCKKRIIKEFYCAINKAFNFCK